jgi:Bacterial Ig-like domain
MAVNSGDVSNLSGVSLFPNAAWLHDGAPTSGNSLAAFAGQYVTWIQTADSQSNSYGIPIQETDGTHGTTTFTDRNGHTVVVPNVTAGGGFAPAGGSDGHLIVVDTATQQYFDFWTLTVNGSGVPTSTHVGRIETGNYATGDGTPGTTATSVTGLAGDILPGELSTSNGIQHALNVAVPANLNTPGLGAQVPAGASGYDGGVNGAPFQEGQEVFIPKSVNIGAIPGLSVAAQAIAHALQNFGGLITDQTGGTLAFYSDIPSTQMPDTSGLNTLEQYLEITTNSSTHSTGTGSETNGTTGTTAITATGLPHVAPTVAITSAGGSTSHAAQTIAGTVDVADAGTTVHILDGTTQIGTAQVAGNGTWSTSVTLAHQGANSLTATDTDAAGNTGSSAAVTYTLDPAPSSTPNPAPSPTPTGTTGSNGTSGTGATGTTGTAADPPAGNTGVTTGTTGSSSAPAANAAGAGPNTGSGQGHHHHHHHSDSFDFAGLVTAATAAAAASPPAAATVVAPDAAAVNPAADAPTVASHEVVDTYHHHHFCHDHLM